MSDDAKRIEIMEAYVQKKKKYNRLTSYKGQHCIRSLSPMKILAEPRIGHVATSVFGGNRGAAFPTDKWWEKKPVLAGESQTPVQKRLSLVHTTAFTNKTAHEKRFIMNEFEFLDVMRMRSRLPAETTPDGAANWSNTALLRQSLRSSQ